MHFLIATGTIEPGKEGRMGLKLENLSGKWHRTP
jgi:hypothetical protein